MVYINPYGGKKKGRKIYEKKVAPLFSLASITTDVIGKKPGLSLLLKPQP